MTPIQARFYSPLEFTPGMWPINLMSLAAAVAAVVGIGLLIQGIALSRQGRTGAFYGIRRDAQIRARNSIGGAVTAFLLAAGLYVLHNSVPAINLPQPVASVEPTTASLPPSPEILPAATRSAVPTVAASATPQPTVTPLMPAPTPTLIVLNGTVEAAPALTFKVIAAGVSPEGQPVGERTRFAAGVSAVYVFFDYQGVPAGALLRHTWTHNGASAFTRSFQVTYEGSGTASVFFAPSGGFEPGLYEVRVMLGGQQQFVANFEVR
jgi:hypothetical protein